MTSLPPTSTQFLASSYNIPEEDDRKKVYLQDNLTLISDTVNDRKIGTYIQGIPSYSGEKWNYDIVRKIRTGYQIFARITSFVPQTIPMPVFNVNPQFVVTLVYGTANLPCSSIGAGDGDYFSFMAQGDVRIQFTVSDTQIAITTDGLRAAYSGFIILQYILDGEV
jgi:hypothetical protein